MEKTRTEKEKVTQLCRGGWDGVVVVAAVAVHVTVRCLISERADGNEAAIDLRCV